MPLVSDSSLNLKNINTDLNNLVSRLTAVLTSAGQAVDILAGPPTTKSTPPVTPNSASAALMSAIYGNLKQLDYLTSELANVNSELADAIVGSDGEEAATSSTADTFRDISAIAIANSSNTSY